MRQQNWFLGILLTILGGVATIAAQPIPRPPLTAASVIAEVGGAKITLTDLEQELDRTARQLALRRAAPLAQARLEAEGYRWRVLARLIDRQMLARRAQELGLDKEIARRVETLLAAPPDSLNPDAAQLRQRRAEGFNDDDLRAQLTLELTRNLLLTKEGVAVNPAPAPDEAELRRYFEAHREQFGRPAVVTLSEILLYPQTYAAPYKNAPDIVAAARSGLVDFGLLAARQSQRSWQGERLAPQTRGLIGEFAVTEISDPVIRAAVAQLPAGGVTDALPAAVGHLVLRVDARREGSAPEYDAEAVLTALAQERRAAASAEYVAGLRQKARITVTPEYLATTAPLLEGAQARALPPPYQRRNRFKVFLEDLSVLAVTLPLLVVTRGACCVPPQ